LTIPGLQFIIIEQRRSSSLMSRKKRSKKATEKKLSQPHAKAFTFFFKEKETAISMLTG
jgi:hypothetical protein